MKVKLLTNEQSDIILKIKRCKKRFDKLDKKLQQPWRNSDVASIEIPHKLTNQFNNVHRKVRSGKITNDNAKFVVQLANAMAMGMDAKLNYQNMQKSLGEEIPPFGQMELG